MSRIDRNSAEAAAIASPDSLLPASTKSFKTDHGALIIDDVRMGGAGGDKGIIGAFVGGTLGTLVCGLGCGIGGAAIGLLV